MTIDIQGTTEDCGAYGPEPHPDDIYIANAPGNATRRAQTWAMMAHDRNKNESNNNPGRAE